MRLTAALRSGMLGEPVLSSWRGCVDPTGEFIGLYNELDQHLRLTVSADRPRAEFMDLVNEAARRGIVKPAMVNELRDCKNLRNILVHTGRHPNEALAEPSDYGLERFRRIVQAICRPERVFPLFRQSVHVFSVLERFGVALRAMAERDYSQVVVRDDDGLGLLSSLGVTGWLAAAQVRQAIDVDGVSIADVLEHEPPGSFSMLGRGAALEEAWDLFEGGGRGGRRLQAIIITEHGAPTEKPIGLITPWDLVADGRDET